MNGLKLIYSFRGRLLLVFAALLVVTLGVQYYLNRRAAQETLRLIEEQQQALTVGVALGMKSIMSSDYLFQLRERAREPLLDPQSGRIINILVVDRDGLIRDSLDTTYNPVQDKPGGPTRYHYLREVRLPPLVNAGDLTEDRTQVPQGALLSTQLRPGEPRAFSFPVDVRKEDNTDERRYVIVALGAPNASSPSAIAVRSLLFTLAILLAATLVATLLVLRFTQPIKELSNAARRVAAGDLDFRVPAAGRRDEMGALAARFNEMIARLGRTRELEARLHQVERSAVVGRLASAIAHEIRNPLNYINLTLDHLRVALAPEDAAKRETFARLTQQLKAEVARINTRISEFLNYTRPSELELEPIDLRAAVEDALRLVEVQAAESGVETRVEQKGEVPAVMCDAESLRSVFTNLFINGLQAIDGQGGQLIITLSTEEPGHRARIDVTDTGPGIAPENISQVFEPYFSTKETGTGLGLAIVKKAVDDHDGTITVKSKEGVGTTFTITLPTERRDEE